MTDQTDQADLLDGDGLSDFIEAHFTARGDRLFRMERLPLYAVDHQSAELTAWREGRSFDLSWKQSWLNVLAGWLEQGMRTSRVRVLSAQLSDDEARACHWGYPLTGQYEDIRVLHRGEHPVPEILDHDYWVITPANAPVQVVRMHYDAGGQFVGASVVDAAEHGPYLTEQAMSWAVGEPFADWWGRHGELHRRAAA